GDGLADPPRRVRRELEALRVVELLDRADQAEVALLDQVEEQHPAPDVVLRDRHDEPQVRLDQLALGELTVALDAAEEVVVLLRRLRLVGLRELLAPDALDLAELVELVLAGGDHAL